MIRPPAVEGKAYIYGLLDPFTLQLRYVGKTKDPGSRFGYHTTASGGHGDKHHKWLSFCFIRGRKPIPIILDLVNEQEATAKEKFWIRYAELCGCDLVNGVGTAAFSRKKKPPLPATVSDVLFGARREYFCLVLQQFPLHSLV